MCASWSSSPLASTAGAAATPLGTEGRLDDLYLVMGLRRDDPKSPPERPARRALDRAMRCLRKRAGRADHAGDLRALAKVTRLFDRKLGDEGAEKLAAALDHFAGVFQPSRSSEAA